jgi:transglutaminase-like putative cysteine protease
VDDPPPPAPAHLARAQALVAGKPTPRDRLAALVEWVEANIQEGGVVAEDAAAILARRKGSRSNLLAALAAAVGLPCELLVARARTASQPPAGAVPDVESYANIVLRFSLGGEVTAQTVDVDPRLRRVTARLEVEPASITWMPRARMAARSLG